MSYAQQESHLFETERLVVRELDPALDGEFIFDLLNRPSFIRNIGDRGVRSVEASRDFIENRYCQSYRDHGFGLYAVDLKSETGSSNVQIGICGLVRRAGLGDPDIGFAFLPQFEGFGYAWEASVGVLRYVRESLGITRVMAITKPENDRSTRLLRKLGFEFLRRVTLPGDDEELDLFVTE